LQERQTNSLTTQIHEKEWGMQRIQLSFFTTGVIGAILFLGSSTAFALEANPRVQDRFSSPSKGKIIPPSSSGQEPFTKQQPTTEQKFNLIFSKLSALEQTVVNLQNQVSAQAQLITQLRQVISVNSSGVVTIQAPGTLKIIAGGNMNLSGGLIDINAGITGIHGMLKADTMMTSTVIAQTYTPGAGNIW
jgi:hypothetical protein